MKKLICRILPIVAVALVIASVSGIAIAQTIDDVSDTPFQINYYSNNTAAGVDGTFRIVNDGALAGGRGSFNNPGPGALCAMIYVHSADQQLVECCGCLVTPNGLQTIDVKLQLTSNTLTGRIPVDGAIKVIASPMNSYASETSGAGTFGVRGAAAVDNSPYCDPTQSAQPAATDLVIGQAPAFGLATWGTHVQNKVGTAYPLTETESVNGTLSASEYANETGLCAFNVSNGSGAGVCDCGKFEQ